VSRKRDEMISLRLSPDEAEAIRNAANQRGQSVSRFLRDAAIGVATGPRCAHCGRLDELAWIVITGEQQPTVHISAEPFSVIGAYRWCGWRCRPCCMRDYGIWVQSGAAA
jgi:hypothetical protein